MNTTQSKTNNDTIPSEINDIAKETVDAAFKVHRKFGPGLLESIYEECLIYELTKKGLNVESQVAIPLYYDGVH